MAGPAAGELARPSRHAGSGGAVWCPRTALARDGSVRSSGAIAVAASKPVRHGRPGDEGGAGPPDYQLRWRPMLVAAVEFGGDADAGEWVRRARRDRLQRQRLSRPPGAVLRADPAPRTRDRQDNRGSAPMSSPPDTPKATTPGVAASRDEDRTAAIKALEWAFGLPPAELTAEVDVAERAIARLRNRASRSSGRHQLVTIPALFDRRSTPSTWHSASSRASSTRRPVSSGHCWSRP